MKVTRTSVVADFRLIHRFDVLSKRLAEPRFAERRDKPLAYWAMASDRRLPLAFMNRTVGELIRTPFDVLNETPGVGRQKLGALVRLLSRAAREMEESPSAVAKADESLDVELDGTAETIASQGVSESVWARWRQCVVDHGLEDEPLGRFAPSLERLPRVVWETPLRQYTGLSLAAIRALKTHGEKRVQAVVEVFGALYSALGGSQPRGPLAVRPESRRVREAADWLLRALVSPTLPSPEEIEAGLIEPLVGQVRVDAGDQVADLAQHRIHMHGPGLSVRQEARRLGLTRARVYQLLADVAEVMRLRWPEGARLAQGLATSIQTEPSREPIYQQFLAFQELFFPVRQLSDPVDVAQPQHVVMSPSSGESALAS